MNGYDFDKTIYQGDSSIDFYWFCLRKNKKVLLQLPQQIWGLIRYTLGFIDRTKFKEYFFSFLKNNKDTKKYVEEFWNKKISKIKPWYIEQKNKSDVILSASPEFLLKPLAQKLGVKVIASKVDIKSGKFLQKNCRGEEKARQFKAEYKNTRLESFYSDSMVDRPMMNLADKAYYVKGDRIYDLNECGGGIVRCVKVDKMIFYAGILFLLIPVLLQLGFWFRKMVAIPCIVLLITATIFALNRFKPLSQMEYHKFFDKRKMFFLAILIIIINLLSGAGGIFPQNWDYNGRNAIFHDLINHEWPVRYDYSGEGLEYERDEFGNEGLLNYYFAWWLPGALVGKATNFEVASVLC